MTEQVVQLGPEHGPPAGNASSAARQDRPIGEILQQVCELSPTQVEEIARYQTQHQIPFGEAAIRLGYARREDVVWALSKQYSYSYLADTSKATINQELVMARNPFSESVECFRSLRTHLAFGLLAAESGKRSALAVVSPNIGDGKTFIISNLAVAFSQLRYRTVVVDADLRSPRAHRIFGVEGAEGLSATLSRRSSFKLYEFGESLQNLFFLPAGAVPPNPTELLHSPEFDLLLTELTKKFDVVLVDTPAAAHGSDARVIAEKCGAALLVVKKDRSRLKDAKTLAAQLRLGSCKIVGPLVNE